MAYDFATTWCCVGEKEQSFLSFMATWTALPDPVVAKSTYDSVWVMLFDEVGSEFYLWWKDNWSITEQEIEIFPGVFVEGEAWPLSDYIALNLWLLDEGSACEPPCYLTSGAFHLPPS